MRANFRAARKQSNPLGARCPMLKEPTTNRAGGCRRIGLTVPALRFERGLVAISRDGGGRTPSHVSSQLQSGHLVRWTGRQRGDLVARGHIHRLIIRDGMHPRFRAWARHFWIASGRPSDRCPTQMTAIQPVLLAAFRARLQGRSRYRRPAPSLAPAFSILTVVSSSERPE